MISDTPKPSRISNRTSTMLPPYAPVMYWSAWRVMGTSAESISSINATAPFKTATISSTRITSNQSPPTPGRTVPAGHLILCLLTGYAVPCPPAEQFPPTTRLPPDSPPSCHPPAKLPFPAPLLHLPPVLLLSARRFPVLYHVCPVL